MIVPVMLWMFTFCAVIEAVIDPMLWFTMFEPAVIFNVPGDVIVPILVIWLATLSVRLAEEKRLPKKLLVGKLADSNPPDPTVKLPRFITAEMPGVS